MTKKIIQLAGKKRSGKDTFAQLLKREGGRKGLKVDVISYATPMKDILAITLDISDDELDSLKNNPDHPHRGYLQRLGTEAMKKYFGDDVWGNLAVDAVRKSEADIIVFADFRFPREDELFAEQGLTTTTVKINRPSLGVDKADAHISEQALNNFEFDFIVPNDGAEKDLIPWARQIIGTVA